MRKWVAVMLLLMRMKESRFHWREGERQGEVRGEEGEF